MATTSTRTVAPLIMGRSVTAMFPVVFMATTFVVSMPMYAGPASMHSNANVYIAAGTASSHVSYW